MSMRGSATPLQRLGRTEMKRWRQSFSSPLAAAAAAATWASVAVPGAWLVAVLPAVCMPVPATTHSNVTCRTVFRP